MRATSTSTRTRARHPNRCRSAQPGDVARAATARDGSLARITDVPASMRASGERPSLTVTVKRAIPAGEGTLASTRIINAPEKRLYATVHLGPAADESELLAHELEHIIEQLDGVDLAAMAKRSGTGVWNINDAGYSRPRAPRRWAARSPMSFADSGSSAGVNGWSPPRSARSTVTSGLALLEPTGAFVTVRQADGRSPVTGVSAPSVSGDGRFVAFVSFARLVDADTDTLGDVYVLDRVSGRVTIETESISLGDHRYESGSPRLSRDGRILVYREWGTPDGLQLLVVRDRQRGTTQIVGPREQAPNGSSRQPAISADGRVVVWASSATNLVDGRTPTVPGRTSTGSTGRLGRSRGSASIVRVASQVRASVLHQPSARTDGMWRSRRRRSSTGRACPNAIARTPNVFVRDTRRGTTTRVSVGAAGASLNGASYDPRSAGRAGMSCSCPRPPTRCRATGTGVRRVLAGPRAADDDAGQPQGVWGSGNGPSGQPAISADGESWSFSPTRQI